MALQFQPVAVRQIARGLDLRSVENSLPPGYSERLRNVTTSSSGHLSKRKGYQGYAGNLPFRAQSITHSGTEISITFDGSVSVLDLKNAPVVVFGRLGSPSAAAAGDFVTNTDNVRYYPSFTAKLTDTIPASYPSVFTTVYEAARYNAAYGNPLFTHTFRNNAFNNDSTYAIPSWDVNTAAEFDIDLDTTLPSSKEAFLFADDFEGAGGTSYATTYTGGNAVPATNSKAYTWDTSTDLFTTSVAHGLTNDNSVIFSNTSTLPSNITPGTEYFVTTAGANDFYLSLTKGGANINLSGTGSGTYVLSAVGQTYEIFASNHQLNTYNIIPQVFLLSGSEWQAVIPQELTVNVSSGTVTFRVLNSAASTLSVKILLVAELVDNVSAAVTGTNVLTGFSSDTGFNHFAQYTVVGSIRTLTYPATATYSDGSNFTTITNLNPTSETFITVNHLSSITVNSIVVNDTTNTSETYIDNLPQLTVWGLDHENAYTESLYGGHVNHIDTYRAAGVKQLVSGLGGNLYTANPYATSGLSYKYGTANVQLQNRFSSQTIAPYFGRKFSFANTDIGSSTLTLADHRLQVNDAVYYQTLTGSAITGLSAGVVYYVQNITDNTFQLSADRDGTVVTFSNSGAATYTLYKVANTSNNVYGSNISTDHYMPVTAAALTAANQVTYTINVTDQEGNFGAAPGLYLNVQDCPIDIYNGTFKIISATATTLTVENTQATLTDFDVSGIEAKCGIFSQKLTLTDPIEFLVGDTLNYERGVNSNLVVKDVNIGTSTVTVTGITAYETVGTSLLVTGTRNTDYVPLTDQSNFVFGDMLAVDNLTRQLRITDVRAPQTLAIETIYQDSGNTRVKTTASHGLQAGDKVYITDTSVSTYNGLRTVTATLSANEFIFAGSSGSPVINFAGRVHKALLSVTVASGIATATVSSNHMLKVDDRILVVGTGSNDGVVTVLSTPSLTSFTFATTSTTNTGEIGYLRGGIIVDESLDWSDDANNPDTLTVSDRWIPIEIPVSADSLPVKNVVTHFNSDPYDEQSILRSAMVSDNLYLTNQADEVYKYDGTNIYHAGLPKWQAQLFTSLTFDNAIPELPKYDITARTGAELSLTLVTVDGLSVGDIIYRSDPTPNDPDGLTFTIVAVDAVANKIFLAYSDTPAAFETYFATSYDIRKVKRYGYYFRLNLIDANNNLLSSAPVGDADYIVDAVGAGSIQHRLVGMPTFGYLDYDRIELQVFRTKANTPGAYYLVQQLDLNFNNNTGYVDITDGVNDEQLTIDGSDQLALNTSTIPPSISGLGTEIGRTWTLPPRAKYVTSVGNRLVLGNIKDYSSQDIVLRKKASSAEFVASDLNGKTLIFRKDATLTGSSTGNMIDRISLSYTTSAVSITPASDIDLSVAGQVTINNVANSAAVGSWIYCFHNASTLERQLRFSGWWQLTARTSTSVTFAYAHGDTGTGDALDIDRVVLASTNGNIPVYVGTDYNYRYFGAQDLDETDIQIRTANAINTSQRMTNIAISGYESFAPWILAYSGSEYGIGTLILRQDKVSSTNFGITTPSSSITSAEYYVQGLLRGTSITVSSIRKLFPSRVVVSYENYPEIFDNPYADAFDSDSVIDVNSADGQDITGIIQFFGESVFGQGTVEDILVVFKTNSVYLVNVKTREISKIQSRGLGCTAPYSIASTKDGIMFANESGIYRLNRDQSISYVGKFVERYWQDTVNKSDLSRATGHHYGVGNLYKLSIPTTTASTTNDSVLVYDHQLEGQDQEFGAWTEYTNHPVTGWANLVRDAYFGATTGRVFVIRNSGLKYDYRDDNVAITSDCILRAMDFDQGGIRKVVASVVSHLQLRTGSQTGTQLLSSVDLNTSFEDCGTIVATKTATTKLVSIRSAIPRRKQVYLQLQYVNAVKDEEFILAGVDLYVSALNNKGILEQAEST